MASTYSNLKIELMGTGDQSGTWGTTTNTNLGTAIEEAITGTADVTFASADVTLTLANTNTAQTARNLRLNLVGTVSAAQNLIVPAIEKQYIVNNTLGYDITVKNSTGTGIVVPAGKSMILFNTGSNVTEAVTYTNSIVYPGAGIPNSTGTAWGTSYTTSGSGTVVALATSPTLTSPTLTTPILGTPQSGTLTSCTGLPLTTGVTGTLPIANGGTGSTSTTYVNLASNVTGTLPVANGGTGSTSTTYCSLTTNVAGTLPIANGGTNLTTYTTGDIVYASATNTLNKLADVATGNALISGGVGVAPSYGKIGLTTHVTGTLPVANGGTGGTLPVANGGTGATTQTAYSVLCGGTTSTGAYQSVASVGTAGQVLTSNGAGALPTFKRITPNSLSLTSTSGAITPNSDLYDQVNYSLTGTSSFSIPSGTPTNGQKLTIRIYAASLQTISSWSSSSGGYKAIGVTLPTSAPAGKHIYVGCIWNSTELFWDVIAVATQA